MKPEERKEQILECAKKLFSKNGYFSTQISDIIREAGIARGTVYQYFENKDSIYLTLLEGYYEKWQAAMSAWADEIDLKTIHPFDYLRSRIRRNLRFFAEDRDLCNILLRMGLGLPGNLESVSKRFEERILSVTVNDLKIGLVNGHVREELDLLLTANLFSGGLLRAAYLYFGKSEAEAMQVDVEEATDKIARIFAPGIFKPKVLAGISGFQDRP